MFDDFTIVLKTNCQMGATMVHCDSKLSMCDCSFYRIVTEYVLNGIGFGFMKKYILGSLTSQIGTSLPSTSLQIQDIKIPTCLPCLSMNLNVFNVVLLR